MAREDSGETALSLACMTGSLECARLLVEHGANVNSDSMYMPPLVSACRSGSLPLVRYLVEEAGADPLVRTVEEETVLLLRCHE